MKHLQEIVEAAQARGKKRLEIAHNEIKKSKLYDYFVINEDIDCASDDVLSIIKAIDFSNKRMNNYISEVIDNV